MTGYPAVPAAILRDAPRRRGAPQDEGLCFFHAYGRCI